MILNPLMPHNNICYAFDLFQFDVEQRVLTREGKAVPLTPKATDILILLLRSAGQLVEKDELMKEVWPNTFVEEANVTQNIFTLRRALGETESGKSYIETVARRGYRFVADVTLAKVPSPGGRNLREIDEETLQQAPPSLAVLPFTNATNDKNFEYLAEGITDNLTNNLSRIDKLRIISRSAVFRLRSSQSDPQEIGSALGVDAVLSGKVQMRGANLAVSAQLIEVNSGWQLWGESFDLAVNDILEVQDEIAREISSTFRLKLTGEEEKRITTRYTENSAAYQAYLEGRHHWSKYTKAGIEKAIVHFREAIELDPNYALAYSGIVDCYLRLATNYLPPEEYGSAVKNKSSFEQVEPADPSLPVRIRHEWDWKNVERESRRANDLQLSYPAAYQWYAAYKFARALLAKSKYQGESQTETDASPSHLGLSDRIPSSKLTQTEAIQIHCIVAREQIDIGNYEAACAMLKPWWVSGQWPSGEGLSLGAHADLLFTAGVLAGCVSSTLQIPNGQKHAETLINGAIALFEHLRSRRWAAEGRIEIALCYYRQGMFDLGRSTLATTLDSLGKDNEELQALALVRLASLERHAGRLNDSLERLSSALRKVEISGPWVNGRCQLELASTYKDMAASDPDLTSYFDRALKHYERASFEFDAIGNHRLSAIVQNNQGFLLLTLGRYEGVEQVLRRARRVFEKLCDHVRTAQVDETIARLYLAVEDYSAAEDAIERSIHVLEQGDEDALLAEALTTKGLVLWSSGRIAQAKTVLEGAHRVAERCGDREGAGRALLLVLERMPELMSKMEQIEMCLRVQLLLDETQQTSTRLRLEKCLEEFGVH